MKEDMQQTSDIALKVTNVSKSFKLPTEKSSSLKNSLFNLIRGVRRVYDSGSSEGHLL